jgi:rhamnosyl/mannosyltransferase
MHILHVYKDYYPTIGGIENHLKLLAEEQAARGHSVTVLVTNRRCSTATEELNGVRIVKSARLTNIASTPISLSLFREVRRLQADIVHLHFPYPLGELAVLLSQKSRPIILTYHSDIVRQQWLIRLYHPLLKRLLANAHNCSLVLTNLERHEKHETAQEKLSIGSTVAVGGSGERRSASCLEAQRFWRRRWI